MRAAIGLSILLAATPLAALAQAPEEPDPHFPALDKAGLAWIAAPKGQRMAQLYPAKAEAKDIKRGAAQLDCTARANGHLDCTVAYESPGDYGFGKAALGVMKTATVKATDGNPLEGHQFSLTLRFGHWPPSMIPGLNRRGLDGTTLVWRKFPLMGDHWRGPEPKEGEAYRLRLECTANAEGYLNCTVAEIDKAPEGFDAAVVEAMTEARVKAQDGGSPEGQKFSYWYNYGVAKP